MKTKRHLSFLIMNLMLLLSFSTLSYTQTWQEIGDNINGEALDFFGSSLSLSKDAQALAVGAPLHTVINSSSSFEYEKGKVEVYNWSTSNNGWVPKGNIIFGDNDYDRLGSALSLSSDGNTLVVSAPFNDDTSMDAGQVRVYLWTGNSWEQKGGDINGSTNEEKFGTTVQISDDGDVLAIGSPIKSINGVDIGQVILYEWAENNWEQKGEALYGNISGDRFGAAISMNEDGNVVAIGAPYNVTNSSSTESGYAKIFFWNSGSWVQRGTTLNGEEAGDFFGASISLNSNGETVAIGAPWNSGEAGWKSGHVRVFEWDNNNWMQLGEDIDGEQFESLSGQSVSLSASGKIIAIGAPWNGLGGHARVLAWINNAWQQQGEDIDGENFSDDFGQVLSLSGDSQTLVIAAPEHGINGTGSGQVKTYDGSDFVVDTKQPILVHAKAFPNPVRQGGQFHIIFDKAYESINIKVYNTIGVLVNRQVYPLTKRIDFNTQGLDSGVYFIKAETDEGLATILSVCLL